VPKTAKYREFLGCCASIEAGEEQPSTGRYIRVYVGPKRQGAEYLEQYDLHFDAAEVSESDIDARLWPVVSAVCRAYTGWVYLELVEASEGYRVIKRARVAQATGEELEEEEDAADGSALASLRTAGVGEMFRAFSSVADRIVSMNEKLTAGIVELSMSQGSAAVELARLEGQVESALEYSRAQVQAETWRHVADTLGPSAIQAGREVLVAFASERGGSGKGDKSLGPQPESGAPRVAWDLRASARLVRDGLGVVTASPAVALSPDVQAAARELGAVLLEVQALAQAAGIDLASVVSEASASRSSGAE
jgi:hypothetical protein